MTEKPKCIWCGTEKDLRPYGPNGAPICFPCMKDDPSREQEARRQLFKALDEAAKVTGCVLISNEGITPFDLSGEVN